MNLLSATVTALLVVGWLPCSSHVLLQHSGLIHQIHSHHHSDHDHGAGHNADGAESSPTHEHDTANHDVADGLVLGPPGKAQAPTPMRVGAPAWLALALWVAVAGDALFADHSGLSPPGTAPPELSNGWQFSSRAAAPVRAPSFAS